MNVIPKDGRAAVRTRRLNRTGRVVRLAAMLWVILIPVAAMAQENAEPADAAPFLDLRLTTTASAPIRAGANVRARAQVLGVEGDYEFQFYVLSPNSEEGYEVIREYDPDPSVVWTAGDEGGMYTMRVLVRKAGAEMHEPTAAIATIIVQPRATVLYVVVFGFLGLVGAGGGAIALVQYLLPPPARRVRVSVIDAPHGMPMHHVDLSPLTGLAFRDIVNIGHDPDAAVNLRDASVSGIPLRVVRTRFARRVRTYLEIEGPQEVQVDGAVVPPGRMPLLHMMRIRVGNFQLRYDAGALPPLAEIVFPDGRCERGDPAEFDFESRPALMLQPQYGGPQHTIPYALIEHVRVYRTLDQRQRFRRTPGSGTVHGPYARVRFQSGRMLRGRVESPDDIERGRFRLYTDEMGGLDHIFVIGDAVAAVRLDEGSADYHEDAVAGDADTSESREPRLKLAGPGPTAVSSQSTSTPTPKKPDVSREERKTERKQAPSDDDKTEPSEEEKRRYRDRRHRPSI